MSVYAVVGWQIPFEELYTKWDCENLDDFHDHLNTVHWHIHNLEGSGICTNYFFGTDMYLTDAADEPVTIDEEAFCKWVKNARHQIMQNGSVRYTAGIYMPLCPRLFIVEE